MSENDFQANQFRTYRAAIDGISLGFIATGTGGYSPRKGEVLQYDGTTVVLSDGREFADVPQLRGAIRERWFVLDDDVAPVHRPRAAGIKVRGTEHRGGERPSLVAMETERAEEDVVVTVEARRRHREKTNAEATRRVPLESVEARRAFDGIMDPEVRAMIAEMDAEFASTRTDFVKATPVSTDANEAQRVIEEDILALLSSITDVPSKPARSRRAEKQVQPAPRQYPVERQEDMHVTLGQQTVDDFGQPGSVVGTVGTKRQMTVERQRDIDIAGVAPAKPAYESPRPTPRLGGSGTIVVDEERDMGAITLSNEQPAIRMGEAATARTNHESIRMGDVEVGRREARAEASESGQEGRPVGRVLSPTHRTFVATDSNTSRTAIERTEQGTTLRVEKYAVHEEERAAGVVGRRTSVATGDVQEALAGEDLPDILPDAATGPAPKHELPPDVQAKYEAVRAMLPNFEWNRDRPMRERVQEALKHIKDPMFVKGILAVETEMAREEIKKALADALAEESKKKGGASGEKKAASAAGSD
jgi:hypothetical protein